jgi:hypothetical protein
VGACADGGVVVGRRDAPRIIPVAFGSRLANRFSRHSGKTLQPSVTVFPELAKILENERPLKATGRRKPFITNL